MGTSWDGLGAGWAGDGLGAARSSWTTKTAVLLLAHGPRPPLRLLVDEDDGVLLARLGVVLLARLGVRRDEDGGVVELVDEDGGAAPGA